MFGRAVGVKEAIILLHLCSEHFVVVAKNGTSQVYLHSFCIENTKRTVDCRDSETPEDLFSWYWYRYRKGEI